MVEHLRRRQQIMHQQQLYHLTQRIHGRLHQMQMLQVKRIKRLVNQVLVKHLPIQQTQYKQLCTRLHQQVVQMVIALDQHLP